MRKNRFQTNSFIKKYQNLINQINNLEESLKVLSDSELRAKNFKLKKRFEENQNLDPLIAESFALTREASLRTVGLRHFDVQLIGGLVLNNQKIAEMKKMRECEAVRRDNSQSVVTGFWGGVLMGARENLACD